MRRAEATSAAVGSPRDRPGRRLSSPGVRVLALVTLPTLGAGNRLRIEQYGPSLRAEGIELVVSPFFDDATRGVLYQRGRLLEKALGVLRGFARRARDLVRARRYDLVLVYRESAPLGPPLVEALFRVLRVPYVYDFDDAIFLRPPYSANRAWDWLRPPSRVASTARGARAVIVGNEYLAEHARRWNERVTIIPTPVDTERHRPRRTERPTGPLVLGWVGSQTTAPYLRLMDDALTAIAKRHDVVVRVVGGRYDHPSARVEELPYDLDREPADLESFDIGLLPEPDDGWTRGKGAFKALLYMATGLPVVASRVGVNPDVVLSGETGFCVDTTDEWVRALEQLLSDPELRLRMGSSGRQRVVERYSLAIQAPRLARVLRDAVIPPA